MKRIDWGGCSSLRLQLLGLFYFSTEEGGGRFLNVYIMFSRSIMITMIMIMIMPWMYVLTFFSLFSFPFIIYHPSSIIRIQAPYIST